MAALAPTFISDVLDEHVEELAFLWGRRRTALRNAAYTIREFADLERRINAHLQGVLAFGDHASPLLEQALAHDDQFTVFAAAFPLLHRGSETATSRVLDVFSHAAGQRLEGLRDALCHGPLNHVAPQLEALFRSAGGPPALAAGEALAFHSALRATSQDLQRWLPHEDAPTRATAWRLVGYLGQAVDPRLYAAAMREGPGPARSAALHAGAWCAEPGIVPACRKLATDAPTESPDALELLAILGGPQDLPLFRAVGDARGLGPLRFRLLGAFGQPALIETVLAGMADPDPPTAVAAGAAFTKMTGQDVDSDRKTNAPPPGSGERDDFEAEFTEEETLPDAELARRLWGRMQPWARAGRLCRGFDVSTQLTREAFAALDMESRWELWLRARYAGTWKGSPIALETFPQAT